MVVSFLNRCLNGWADEYQLRRAVVMVIRKVSLKLNQATVFGREIRPPPVFLVGPSLIHAGQTELIQPLLQGRQPLAIVSSTLGFTWSLGVRFDVLSKYVYPMGLGESTVMVKQHRHRKYLGLPWLDKNDLAFYISELRGEQGLPRMGCCSNSHTGSK